MNNDHEHYVVAGNSFKLIGILCIIVSLLFFALGYDIKEIDYIDLFLTGSFIFACGNMMVKEMKQ